jgi:hypothetical protein
MDWQVTKARIFEKAATGASAAGELAARYIPGLARRGGAVSVFLDGKAAGIAVIRPVNRHSRVEMSAAVTFDEDALTDPAAAGAALAESLVGLARRPRTLVVAVGAELTFERKIALPGMPVEETDAAVEFQADRVLPFAAGEMRFDYAVESTGADGVQTVVISAITEDTARKIEALAAAMGLNLAAVYAAPGALYAAVAAPDETSDGLARAVVYRRQSGIEIAVGSAKVAVMSRFARSAASNDVAAELRRTASAAGIDLGKGAVVFGERELLDALMRSEPAIDVRPLETALEASAGSCGEGSSAAAAIAAGTLYVRGAQLPNFQAPAASVRRKERKTKAHGRVARYAAGAGAVVAFVVLCITSYWIYTAVLESRANGLAAANSALKAAIGRADTARPWLAGRTRLLDVLAGVTDVFPDSPAAFVKSLSVAESGKVSMQGKVSNPKAAYDLVAALSNVKGFRNVKLDNGAADASGGYGFAVSFEVENWGAMK